MVTDGERERERGGVGSPRATPWINKQSPVASCEISKGEGRETSRQSEEGTWMSTRHPTPNDAVGPGECEPREASCGQDER